MVAPDLALVTNYVNKQIRYSLRSAILKESKIGSPPSDTYLLQVAEDQINSTLNMLVDNGIINNTKIISGKIVNDVLTMDISFAPITAVNSVNVTFNVNTSSSSEEKVSEEETEERRFQVYIENKTW